MIIFYVLDQLRSTPLRVSSSQLSMLGFGLLAGMIGGATNAMAPFLMMYLLSCQLSKTDIVIISNLNFIASKLVQLTLLFPILISLQTHQRHILLGITLFALIGVWLGGKIRHRLSQQHFKYLVLFFYLDWGFTHFGKVWDYYNTLLYCLNNIFLIKPHIYFYKNFKNAFK